VAALLVIILLYNDLFSTTFDEEYAKVTGIKTERIHLILTSLTSITVVLAVKVVGIMLVSALLILPAVTALQIAKGFKAAMLISMSVAVISVLVGITVSFFLDLPAGATIVMTNVMIFAFTLALTKYFS
jgi:zinc transport system permease protein